MGKRSQVRFESFYKIQLNQLKTNKFKFQQTLLISYMLSTPKKSQKSEIQSPFVECVSQCRSSMQKLRKKIYKHIKNHPDYHKQHSQPFRLIETLKTRSIPQKLLKKIAQDKHVNFSSLNCREVENMLPMSQVKKCADLQENETKQILQEWKNSLNIRESKLSKSEQKNTRKAQKIWLLNTQIENEQYGQFDRSSPTPFQGEQLFPNSFGELNSNKQIDLSIKSLDIFMQIGSNIFEESNIYTFK